MDYLREYAEELGLARVLGAFTEREDVQGAILTLDDWWLTAWKLSETGRLREWEWWWREWRHFMPGPMPPFFGIGNSMAQDPQPWIPTRRPDLSWRPQFWDEYAHFSGRGGGDLPPVRLIICLRPPDEESEKVRGIELPETRLPISFEVRPAARLANLHRAAARPLVGGVSIGVGAREFGTLGGVVEDSSGVRFGATCAHVFPKPVAVDQPAQHDDRRAKRVGTSDPVALQPCTSPTPCNPYMHDPHIVDVDTALIALKRGVAADLEVLSIGPLAGVVSKRSMSPGQSVEFAGRTSGHRFAEIGGLALFYRLRMGEKTYCFRDLFEVRWKNFVQTVFGPVVRAGDSGAWVVTPTAQGSGWCGQIIGEDRHIGYAAFAENTIAEWGRRGRTLRVV
jgi:hypothetical protein